MTEPPCVPQVFCGVGLLLPVVVGVKYYSYIGLPDGIQSNVGIAPQIVEEPVASVSPSRGTSPQPQSQSEPEPEPEPGSGSESTSGAGSWGGAAAACAGSPCLHGGTCGASRTNSSSFICECLWGWSGPTCADNLDDCLSSPCSQNGTRTCSDQLGSYRCICKPGWEGQLCSHDVDEVRRRGLVLHHHNLLFLLLVLLVAVLVLLVLVVVLLLFLAVSLLQHPIQVHTNG